MEIELIQPHQPNRFHPFNEPSAWDATMTATATLSSQLDVLCRRVEAVRDKFQSTKVRPVKGEEEAFRSFASRITQAAAELSKAIRTFTESVPNVEGSKLLAQARECDARNQLNKTILKRNLNQIFKGPEDSALDSKQVKARKKVLRERCAIISGLRPETIVRWAKSFPPSVWAAGAMSQDTFDYLTEELDSEETGPFSSDICTVLRTLEAEEPLNRYDQYHDLIKSLASLDDTSRGRALASDEKTASPLNTGQPMKRMRTESEPKDSLFDVGVTGQLLGISSFQFQRLVAYPCRKITSSKSQIGCKSSILRPSQFSSAISGPSSQLTHDMLMGGSTITIH